MPVNDDDMIKGQEEHYNPGTLSFPDSPNNNSEDMEEINDPSFYDGFDISRSAYFAQRNDPIFTFNDGKIGLNTCCVRKFPDVDYVQLLVNREKKLLAIRPCDEYDIFPFRWCNEKNGKRLPRCVVGRLFHLKICDLMGWNPQDRYRVIGSFLKANGERIILFNLQSIQVFPRLVAEDGKKKASKIGFMQENWKNTFGIPFTEREKAMQISLFDGFTMFSFTDGKEQKIETNEEEQ